MRAERGQSKNKVKAEKLIENPFKLTMCRTDESALKVWQEQA